MTPRQVRWACPLGAHAAVLAPTKPRADDVRRFCLECSKGSGRLVRRVAPVLEKKRETRKEQRAARVLERKRRHEARETAYYTVAGLDVRAVRDEILKAPCFHRQAPNEFYRHTARNPPSIRVRRVKDRNRISKLGHASWRKRELLIVVWEGIDQAGIKDTIAHEMAHFAAPHTVHGVAWRTAFRLICEQAFGFRPRLEDGRYAARETEPLHRAIAARASDPGGES
jgi:hypothetical protein